jgi:hypothetical protein
MQKQKGSILIYEVVLIFIFTVVALGVLSNITSQMRAIRSAIFREQAFQIAEAGANYYQWHLAHFPTDYKDGTSNSGPYVHTYVDSDTQENIGEYSLEITPPVVGSTIVTIKSTGYTYANPKIKRTLTVRYGIPSLAQYAFITNSPVWIGASESVDGPVFSNNGIRFDGTGNAPIMSAKATYTCPAYQGSPCPASKTGIWGSAAQATKNFWDYPVPAADFSTITSDFSSLKTKAQTSGIYLPPSNGAGYSLVFNSAGTVTIYKVTNLRSNPTGWDVNGGARNEKTDYNNRNLIGTQNLPTNGVIYIEDKTWVEGTVKGRVTVAAANLPYNPGTAPSIYIPNNIIYASKDGTNSLGLIAQQDILPTYYAPDTLEINAALLAQNGSTQFLYWPNRIKTNISLFGSLMSFGVWTWTWLDGAGNVVSGYRNTLTTYDANLLYAPPPHFPNSTSGYQQISWSSD